MIRWCPVAMVLLLAACGDGAPSVSGPPTPAAGPTGRAGDEGNEGLAGPDGQRLDQALSTTDLSLEAEVGDGGIELVATNQGPNPADEVWIEVGPVSVVGPPADLACEAGPVDLSCPLGPMPARGELRLAIAVPSGTMVIAVVTDRAGHDPAPDDNRVEVAAR